MLLQGCSASFARNPFPPLAPDLANSAALRPTFEPVSAVSKDAREAQFIRSRLPQSAVAAGSIHLCPLTSTAFASDSYIRGEQPWEITWSLK